MNNKLLTQLKILRLMEIKPNFSELARIYDTDRRTIKKYYDGYEGKPKHRKKFCRLDLYQELITQKLQIRGVTLKAVYEFLVSEVDSEIGGYSNFLKYAKSRKLAPAPKCPGHPRFETPPGYQAQADWKEDLKLHNRNGIVYTLQVFDYKLGHSRYCHFTYKTTRTRQDVFDCLIASFQATGGVPTEILFDNMTSVVDLADGHRRINQQMRSFAEDFHFKIRLAKPRHLYTKGKVEAANKFLTWLLPYDREFDTEEELIAILEKINRKVNREPCQETNVPPLLLLQKEKEHLQSLPNQKIIESYLSYDRQIKVQKDSMITYKNHKYSVSPAYIGKNVWIRPTEEKLYIYYNTEMIAVHNLSKKDLIIKKTITPNFLADYLTRKIPLPRLLKLTYGRWMTSCKGGTMPSYTKLMNGLTDLGLHKIQEHLDFYIKAVNSGEKSFSDALEELIEIEKANNQLRAINACVKTANFPFLKTVDDFDFSFQPGINRKEILEFTSLGFIERMENILFVGSSGVGKTHLATAIGIECARNRYSTYFISFENLINQLKRALLENRLEARMKFFSRYKVLIIDELWKDSHNSSYGKSFVMGSSKYK